VELKRILSKFSYQLNVYQFDQIYLRRSAATKHPLSSWNMHQKSTRKDRLRNNFQLLIGPDPSRRACSARSFVPNRVFVSKITDC